MRWFVWMVIVGCSSSAEQVDTTGSGGGGGGSGGQGGAVPVEPEPTGALRWAKSFGAADYQLGRGLAARGDGSTVVTGGFRGQVDFGGGLLVNRGDNYDAVVLGLDAGGAHDFSLGAGQVPFDDISHDVAFDAEGNAVVIGFFSQSIDIGGASLSAEGFASFVVKLDRSGTALWGRAIEGIDGAFDVAVDTHGDITLAGGFVDSVSFGGAVLETRSDADAFVARLDPQGSHLWSRALGGTGSQLVRAIAVADDGDVVVAGAFNDELVLADTSYLTSQAFFDWDAFVARLDPQGDVRHGRVLSGGGNAGATAVAVGPTGEVAVGGIYEGELDIGGPQPLTHKSFTNLFVVMLEATGDLRFATSSSGGQGSVEYDEGGLALAIDPWGNTIAAGPFNELLDFGAGPIESAGFDDVFVTKLDPRGAAPWQQRFGAFDSQVAEDIAVDASGRIYVAGSFHNTLELGTAPPLMSQGDLDIFVLSLDP